MISIIIPVRNRTNFLFKTVESICSQTYTDWEILIIDYGGTDNCESIKDMFPKESIQYFHIPEYGQWNLSRARNIGIRKARGDIIVSLDSDILLDKNVLKVLSDYIKCYENRYIYQIQRTNITENNKYETQPLNSFLGCFQATTKDNFMKIRGFNEDLVLYGWEDQEIIDRFKRIGVNQYWLPGIKIYHQYHPSNPGMNTWPNRFRSWLNKSYLANDENWGYEYEKKPSLKEKLWRVFDFIVISIIIRPIKLIKKCIRYVRSGKWV